MLAYDTVTVSPKALIITDSPAPLAEVKDPPGPPSHLKE